MPVVPDPTRPPVLRTYGVGVRVSAHLRRGAAPYADGAQGLVQARTGWYKLAHFKWIIGIQGAILHNVLSRPLYHRGLLWIMSLTERN